jgi:hypothetical protein
MFYRPKRRRAPVKKKTKKHDSHELVEVPYPDYPNQDYETSSELFEDSSYGLTDEDIDDEPL